MPPMQSACHVSPNNLVRGISIAELRRLGIEAGPISTSAFRIERFSSSSALPSLIMSLGTATEASWPMRPSRSIACFRLEGSSATKRSIRCGTADLLLGRRLRMPLRASCRSLGSSESSDGRSSPSNRSPSNPIRVRAFSPATLVSLSVSFAKRLAKCIAGREFAGIQTTAWAAAARTVALSAESPCMICG